MKQTGSWEMREDLDTAAGLPSAQQKVPHKKPSAVHGVDLRFVVRGSLHAYV